MRKLKIISTLLFTLIANIALSQTAGISESGKLGFYFQPEYSSILHEDHVGNAVGFGLGIVSKNNKWDFGIRYFGRSGPINLHHEYELVLPAGETYKGMSSIMLGADHGFLGLEAAYHIKLQNDRLSIRIPVSFGQFGAGFYLKGEDRFTPDGQRTSVWEDELQGGSDAGFGLSTEVGAQFVYQISSKNEHIHLMTGATYMNTYGYESFLGGTDFLNNKLRLSLGFRLSI
jgi:hypothetical protein